MKCRNIQKKLSAYQDGELAAQEANEVRSHLLNCRLCRDQYEELQRTWENLGGLEEIRPDPWFCPQVLTRIKESPEETRPRTLQRMIQLLRIPAIASVLLVIGIMAGNYLGNILVRCDFLPFRPAQPTYSQEAFLDSLKVFDPAPPGSLAYGYLQMADNTEKESR